MKTIYSIIVIAVVLGFTSCTTADHEVYGETSFFESVKSTYGVENASYNIENTTDIPSVSTEEMRSVLETLRQESKSLHDYTVTSEGKNQKVVMTGKYKIATRGVEGEGFALQVALKFSYEREKVYYWGTDYSYSSDMFDWRAQGLTLAPVKGGDFYTYAFESESYLYFRVNDQANVLVQVAIVFKGDYNFQSGNGAYSFQLLKYCK